VEICRIESVDQYIESFCSYIDDYRQNLNKQGIWLFLATLGIWSVQPSYLQQVAMFITFTIFASKLFKEWKEEGRHFTFKAAAKLVENKINDLEHESEKEFFHQVFVLKKERKLNVMLALKETYVYVLTFLFFVMCYFEMFIWKTI
jgi:hypothetical protein